jgi:hypothetical protein
MSNAELDKRIATVERARTYASHLCLDFRACMAGANPCAYFRYLRNESASSSYDLGCTPSVLASNFTIASLCAAATRPTAAAAVGP